jgi:AcrR family transcriptional regulator
MAKTTTDLREHILDTAGRLFAEHGFNGVSARLIAGQAKINQSSIHYHFGSKEELYGEVLKNTYSLNNVLTIDKLLEEDPNLLETPAKKAHAVYRIISDKFRRILHPPHQWKKELMLRELQSPSPVYMKVIQPFFNQEVENLIRFYFILVPDAALLDACTWVSYPDSQAVFYLSVMKINQQFYEPDFLEALYRNAVKTTTRMMIQLLDLPVPEILY